MAFIHSRLTIKTLEQKCEMSSKLTIRKSERRL